jgi:hypothetical protein
VISPLAPRMAAPVADDAETRATADDNRRAADASEIAILREAVRVRDVWIADMLAAFQDEVSENARLRTALKCEPSAPRPRPLSLPPHVMRVAPEAAPIDALDEAFADMFAADSVERPPVEPTDIPPPPDTLETPR